jgi:hypothetical protein
MMLYEIGTTWKVLYVVAKNEWEARDKAIDYLKDQIHGGGVPHIITSVQEVASSSKGRHKNTLLT